MSAESTLVFYGFRFEIPEDEIEALDRNDHPLIKQARTNGLQFYGGNFAEPDERYLLFIGTKIGVIGAENLSELIVFDEELDNVSKKTLEKLEKAGMIGNPQLYVQWMPDA